MKNSKHNIYEKADKFGKVVKKYGGYVVTGLTIVVLRKAPDTIKKIKK